MMNGPVYDVPISEAARTLEKSDRQVRRYVKGKRLNARPTRVNGHIKLMFNREEVLAFRERYARDEIPCELDREIVVDARLINGAERSVAEERVTGVRENVAIDDVGAVIFVIDTLRQQIDEHQRENRELHYQLEQRSGQVGFLQGKIETLQEELKMLAPAVKSQDQTAARKPWYRRLFGRG